MLQLTTVAQNHPTIPTPSEITEDDYAEAIQTFASDSILSEEILGKALNTAQSYLMSKSDTEGMISLWDTAAAYAKRTGQEKEYVDLVCNKAQLLTSNSRAQESIDILDDVLATYAGKTINNFSMDRNFEARINKAIGDSYDDLEDLNKAMSHYNRSLQISTEDRDTNYIAMSCIAISRVQRNLGNIYDAIDYNIRALNILDSKKDAYLTVGAANILNSIFEELDNDEKALEYAQVMYDLSTMKGYKRMVSIASAALAKQYLIRKQYADALQKYEESLAYLETKRVQMHGKSDASFIQKIKKDMAKIYLNTGNLTKTREILDEAKNIEIQIPETTMTIDLAQVEVEYLIKKGQANEAQAIVQQLKQKIGSNLSLKHRMQVAWLDKTLAEAKEDYRSTNEALVRYHALRDSIADGYKTQLIFNMEEKYQRSQKEKQIDELSAENTVATTKLKQKNSWLMGGGIALAILGFLLLQLYNLYTKNKHNKEQLATQNDAITVALEDKNTLLKEIHHRVKNNLQVISSLLSLQSRFVTDEGTLDAIKAGKSRVQSMSLLHQNLYRDDNLKGVEMKQYFENLGQNLFDTYNISNNIKFKTDISDITLDIDTVVPIGLITNELISNSLKHAFVGKEKGEVAISLHEQSGRLILTVSDDGVGLPDAELPVSTKSLGATLVQSFADKLEADIIIDNTNGSSIRLEIVDYQKV